MINYYRHKQTHHYHHNILPPNLYLDMKFNALKSNMIRYGPKCTNMNIELHVDSIAIPCVNRVKYLGVYLMSARSYKVCWYESKKNFLDCKHHQLKYPISYRFGVIAV